MGVMAVLCMACTDLVDVDIPKNQLTGKAVFADSITATGALLNVLVTHEQYINTAYLALYTDELIYPQSSETILEFYQSRIAPNNSANSNYWSRLYSMAYQCNAIIENSSDETLSPGASEQLEAEARFLRAYTYLLLQNLYGHIPLVLTTDVSVSSRASQVPEAAVYEQVIQDLEHARAHLPVPATGTDNLRANGMSAAALLARASLYAGRWEDAARYATELIQSPLYRLEVPPNVFAAASAETIFQIASQQGAVAGVSSLVPPDAATAPTYPLSTLLVNAFEAGDTRRTAWIGTSTVPSADGETVFHYSAKYRNRTGGVASPEHLVCIRLGELYLIRAEARARMEDIAGAMDDVNALRQRSGLGVLDSPGDAAACLDIILEERRKELFLEGPHRLFDLRRFGKLDAVIGALKPTWQPAGVYFPIPLDELRYNRNLEQHQDYLR